MSGVEIVNAALVHLGEDQLTSLEQPGNQVAGVVSARYPRVRDALLRRYRWNFAEHMAALGGAPLAAPAFGLTHACDLPAGPPEDAALPYCLRVREIEGTAPWRVVGRALHVGKAPPITIRYTKRVVDVSQWDALAFELCAAELAVACAGRLGTSEQRDRVSMRLGPMLRSLRAEARRVDAQEASPRRIQSGRPGAWDRPRRVLP